MLPKALISLVLAFVVCVNCAKFPPEFPLCKKTDSDCMVKTAELIVRAAATPEGLPALGIPSLAPLLVPGLTIKQGADSPVSIELTFKDIQLSGFEDIVFKKIAGFEEPVGQKEVIFKMKVFPVIGDYSISGKVLVLPIQGSGKCNLTLTDYEVTLKFTTSKVERDGKTYLQMDKSKMQFTESRLYNNFENLFNGDKLLGDTTNLFLNENWKDIMNELRPNLSIAFGKVFESLTKNVLNAFPYNELFSE